MNTSRDMESVNDAEVVSPKTNPVEVPGKRTYAEINKFEKHKVMISDCEIALC